MRKGPKWERATDSSFFRVAAVGCGLCLVASGALFLAGWAEHKAAETALTRYDDYPDTNLGDLSAAQDDASRSDALYDAGNSFLRFGDVAGVIALVGAVGIAFSAQREDYTPNGGFYSRVEDD